MFRAIIFIKIDKSYLVWLIFLLLISFSSIKGGNLPIKITGRILNAENSEPIQSALIQIIEENQYTTSSKDGIFSFTGISKQKFRIKITHLSYHEKIIDVEINNESDKYIIVYLIPRTINLSPIVILGEKNPSIFEQISEYSLVLQGKELQKELGQTLASTLKNETSLAIRSMGPAPARPIYRGLGQNRIVISEDGIKTTDLSATSPDHAVTLEPFTLERIEVIRGSKILTRSSTTIGGIVNVVRKEIPEQIHNQIHFTFGGYTETSNNGWLGSVTSEIPIKPFAARFELSQRKTQNLKTPLGILDNSYSKNLNGSFGLSLIKNFGFVGSSYRIFNLTYGIPGGFIGAHPKGVKIEIGKQQFNAASVVKLTNDSNFIKIQLGKSYYRHKEFEHSGLIGSEFLVQTYQGNLDFNHSHFTFFNKGIFGFSFEYIDFNIGGYVFTPPTRHYNFSTYIYEEFTKGKFNLDFALRFDYDRIVPEVQKISRKIGEIRKRTFTNLSASLLLIYQVSKIVYLGTNISRSTRVPTIEELFSEGPHLAAYSYEVGNPNLNSEKGYGFEFFVYHKFNDLDFNINAFYNDLNSFIIPRNKGTINYQTFLPVYATQGVGAKFYGFEGAVKIKIINDFSARFSFSKTIGIFKDSGKPLPQIPPTKGLVEFIYNGNNLIIGLNSNWALAQNRVDDFEEPTAGYIIYNAYFHYNFFSGKLIHNVSLTFENIFNSIYRNHLSRIKSILPEPGRNLRIVYKILF